MSARILKLTQEPKGTSGRFERNSFGIVRFVEDNNGLWTIYSKPQKYVKYICGADVAEGNEWGDYDAAHIINCDSKEQVAVFHGHIDIDMYAEELELGGNYYNNALLNPEVNFNPGLILNLERRHYPKIYMRQVTNTITKGLQNKYGWRTDKYNRQGMISDLVEFIRDYCYLVNDVRTLEEMLTFVRDEKGKPKAQEGKHDDLVMALSIALQTVMSGQGGMNVFDEQIDISKLPEDMQEDYYKADKYTKKYLIKKWGISYKSLINNNTKLEDEQ